MYTNIQNIINNSSVQFSRSVVSASLRPHELQNARPPCPSPTPGVHSDSRPSSQWCHPAISSSVVPFSSCPQSLSASESFPKSQLLAWGGQSTGVSGRGKKISVLRDRNSSGTSSTLRKKESQNNQKDDGSVFTFIPIILPLNSVLSKGQKKNKGKQLYYHMLTIFWVIKSYTS